MEYNIVKTCMLHLYPKMLHKTIAFGLICMQQIIALIWFTLDRPTATVLVTYEHAHAPQNDRPPFPNDITAVTLWFHVTGICIHDVKWHITDHY